MLRYLRAGSPGSGAARLRTFFASHALATCFLLAATTFAGSAAANGFHHFDSGGAVYVMSNASSGNEIFVYLRGHRGELRPLPRASAATGGLGAGDNAPIDPLGSQGALVYDAGTDLLFAVNAGDDTVTAFDPGPLGLRLRRRALVSSGGFFPVSVAVSENHLYVLNAGATGTVATFEIGDHGGLTQVGSLDLSLSGGPTELPLDPVPPPGQIGVDALARQLIITHAGGQELLTIALDDDGVPAGVPVSTMTPGAGPFAFGVTPYGSTLVAEAATGSVSAFDPPAGTSPLAVTAAAVATGQVATCWIAVLDGGYAYVSNTGSGTLSLFGYTRTGGLALVDALAASPGGAPIDLAVAGGGGLLYALDAAGGQIVGFAVDAESGALTPVETQGGLPAAAGLQGIAARDFDFR